MEIPDVSLGPLVLEPLSAYDDGPALIGGVTEPTTTWGRLAGASRKDPRVKQEVFSRMPPDKIADLALRFGPYGYWGGHASGQALSLHELKQAPHGIDLGPPQPCFPERLVTWSRRI